MLSIFSCAYWPFVFFGEMSIQVLCTFLRVFCCCCFILLLSYQSSLYNLDINPLSDTGFANIFSYSVGCAFTLLIVSFDTQNLKISMKSYVCVCIYIYIQIIFHYRILQDTEYSSLCYTVGSCCLSILCIVVCVC